jgi:Immune inhibitor A-like, MAM domain
VRKMTRHLTVGAATLALLGAGTAVALATTGSAGDDVLTVTLNDSHAGGSYDQPFEKVYANTTPAGRPVYIYVPEGGVGDPSVDSLNPAFDHNPSDAFTPCADNAASDYLISQDQIDFLGDELTNHIVATDEAHYGPAGTPAGGTDAVVMLVYNVQDESYYDCSVSTYTAGYFAPEYIDEAGMNVVVVDAFDWANRIGDDAAAPNLYEGVIAHELEHLLMNYSDPGEPSWVDEGLADMAIFLNGYSIGGSHLTYHQVFHRETSLIRWGGGLENYGASLTYFLYLWERAGGNGDGTYEPDSEYDNAGGDLLIKRIFQNQADSIEGVQAAIDQFNSETGADLPSAVDLFKDWAVTVKLDAEGSDLWDLKNANFGDPASTSWTIDIANNDFWDARGVYQGRMSDGKYKNKKNVPPQVALPFGVSYETFRNPGPVIGVDFQAAPSAQVAPHSGTEHWWGGATSQHESILDVDSTGTAGGAEVNFWTWYFIEDGWDYGYLEAQVGADWVTVPLFRDGVEVTTDTNPHDNNTEGNGLTGTSGGVYFVDEPQYVNLTADLPAGTTDVRFRYSTDAAYTDTGFFVDDSVTIGGQPASLSSAAGNWLFTTGAQDNNWVVQILAPCDLTPGVNSAGETADNLGNHLYRYEGDTINAGGLSTSCLHGQKRVTAIVSNLTSGDIQVLDAPYQFRLTGAGVGE